MASQRPPFKPASSSATPPVTSRITTPVTSRSTSPVTSRSYNGPSAGHARFPTSVATSLARTGQLQTHITQNSLFTPGQFMPIFSQPWNSRTPVWERQIPDHSLRPAPKQRRRAGLPSLASERPSTVGSIGTVSSDWPLLLSQERPFRVRRPWPGVCWPSSSMSRLAPQFTLRRLWQSTSRRPPRRWAGGGRAPASASCTSTAGACAAPSLTCELCALPGGRPPPKYYLVPYVVCRRV